jgi:hypothetical protein
MGNCFGDLQSGWSIVTSLFQRGCRPECIGTRDSGTGIIAIFRLLLILVGAAIALTGCDPVVHLGNFDPETTYEICNRASRKCLDIQDASTEVAAPLVQNTLSRTSTSQSWTMVEKFPGKYKFVNVATTQCAEAANGVNNGSVNGGRLQQDICAGDTATNQMWSFTMTGDGFYKIGTVTFENGAGDGSIDLPSDSVSADGAATVQNRWNGSASQQWRITPR